MTEAIGNKRNQSLGRQRARNPRRSSFGFLSPALEKKNSKGGAKTETSSSAGNSNKIMLPTHNKSLREQNSRLKPQEKNATNTQRQRTENYPHKQ